LVFGVFTGARRLIDVFDCDTHSPEKMTVHQFVRYYMSDEKEKLLNVTSLEFSQTGMDRLIETPATVTQIIVDLLIVFHGILLVSKHGAGKN
jgi:hypothetical protein